MNTPFICSCNTSRLFHILCQDVSYMTSTHTWECRGRSPLPGVRGCPSLLFFLAGRRPTYTVMSRCQKYPLDKLVSSEYICIIRKSSYESKSIEHNNQGEGNVCTGQTRT